MKPVAPVTTTGRSAAAIGPGDAADVADRFVGGVERGVERGIDGGIECGEHPVPFGDSEVRDGRSGRALD